MGNNISETDAILLVLEGSHPGNCFNAPYSTLDYSIESETDWLAAVPEGWKRFSRLLELWFAANRKQKR